MSRLAPRITYHENGTVTVSGIPRADFRSILTAAWLYRHEQRENLTDTDAIVWDRRITNILKLLEVPAYVCPYANRPLSELTPYEISIRRRDAILKRNDRIRLDKIMKEIFG